MGVFVMIYSINRQNELKAKSSAILKAIIDSNNRMVYSPVTTKPTAGSTPLTVYTGKNIIPQKPKNNDMYKAYMWVTA